jgi:hypothetical protein
MGSIISKAAIGLGAAALALGLGASPAFAATPTLSQPSGAATTQTSGHWEYGWTASSSRSCFNAEIYYTFLGIEAQCRNVDGSYQIFFWVND